MIFRRKKPKWLSNNEEIKEYESIRDGYEYISSKGKTYKLKDLDINHIKNSLRKYKHVEEFNKTKITLQKELIYREKKLKNNN